MFRDTRYTETYALYQTVAEDFLFIEKIYLPGYSNNRAVAFLEGLRGSEVSSDFCHQRLSLQFRTGTDQ
jgi:hypothetical protein